MSPTAKKLVYWTPRILGILFAIFISLFALDVFNENRTFWEAIGAFFIHLIPTYVVIIVLIVAWKWEWIGAVLCIGLGIFYTAWTWGKFTWLAYAVISGGLILVGILFLLNWKYRAELRQ